MKIDLTETHKKITSELSLIGSELSAQRGARDAMRKTRDADHKRAMDASESKITHSKAALFLMNELSDRRKTALVRFEDMSTAAIGLIYGDCKLHFNTFDEKRKDDGVASFQMALQIESPYQSGTIVTGLKDERGGGMQEAIAWSLRTGALSWTNYGGPMLMDEAYKSMSHDEKVVEVAKFLRQVSHASGRQVVFGTHKADTFGVYADNIIKVTMTDGISSVTSLTVDEPLIDDDEDEDDDRD